ENKKVNDWNDDEINAIRKALSENFKLEGELRSETQMNIKRLMEIGSQRVIRQRFVLPFRVKINKNN
ncbi:30S ribosomal protein S13, partial [Ornithobacterium rhinotracheale]